MSYFKKRGISWIKKWFFQYQRYSPQFAYSISRVGLWRYFKLTNTTKEYENVSLRSFFSQYKLFKNVWNLRIIDKIYFKTSCFLRRNTKDFCHHNNVFLKQFAKYWNLSTTLVLWFRHRNHNLFTAHWEVTIEIF